MNRSHSQVIQQKSLPLKHQQGAALVISLIILVILTIIGVASMSSGNLSEKMAINTEEKSITFYAGQSANNAFISEGLNNPNFLPQLYNLAGGDPQNNTDPLIRCIQPDGRLIPCKPGVNVDLNSSIKARSNSFWRDCAPIDQRECPGNSIDMASDSSIGCHIYEVWGRGWNDMDQDNVIDGIENNDDLETNTIIYQKLRQVAAC